MARSRWISDLHWVRPSRQSRSRKTQEGLLDAAQALFSEKGIDATSVADVATRAGNSVGSVYHHFRDKGALLYALLEREGEAFLATTREAVDPARWEGASVADILTGYVEFSLEVARSRAGYNRAVLEAVLHDPALRERQRDLSEELMSRLTDLLLARRTQIGHPEPELAVAFVLDQLSSMVRMRFNDVTQRPRLEEHSDEAFLREAIRSACGYLQAEPPGELAI